MPRRTKEQKIRASVSKATTQTPRQDSLTSKGEGSHAQFKKDLTKSLIIILAIIALEFVLYYGTMNNRLSLIMKLGK